MSPSPAADLGVAESEARRLEALVGYLKLFAPTTASSWPATPIPGTSSCPGPATRRPRCVRPTFRPAVQAAPIYVVDRTDIVRIYVDIPERDANYVHIGSQAHVKLWAFRDEWLPASVTRLSWALNTQSRTMRAEIDLPNPGSQILPGMYAYGEVVVERPDVRACPSPPSPMPAANRSSGGTKTAARCRTEVETGISDGEWIEVTNRRVKSDSGGEDNWVPIDGSEQVLVGDKTIDPHRERSAVRLTERRRRRSIRDLQATSTDATNNE